ncbi:MAG TPA: hypothetical protein VE007_00735 [Thermoanaerobaculia bacterium]|nr:hypothetical protein [Thermoanaerobaculia bacterium]
MLTTEDFTSMPEGLLVPLAGRVSRCPLCSRNGIETLAQSGTATFLHVQTSEVMCDGMLVEPQDCCVLFDSEMPQTMSLVALRN